MAACCLIAAFLVAQAMAMLRRWAVFWGLMPVPEGEVADTVYTRMAAWLRRPRVRIALGALLVAELSGASLWLYSAHGDHIAQEADIFWSRLHGEQVIYADLCGPKGGDSVRMIVDAQGMRHPTVGG